MTLTDEQRRSNEALARLRRALSGQPEPRKSCEVVDELFRRFGIGVTDKEVRDAK